MHFRDNLSNCRRSVSHVQSFLVGGRLLPISCAAAKQQLAVAWTVAARCFASEFPEIPAAVVT
jgi:hypothetical protein